MKPELPTTVMITIAKRARPMRLIEWPEGRGLVDATDGARRAHFQSG